MVGAQGSALVTRAVAVLPASPSGPTGQGACAPRVPTPRPRGVHGAAGEEGCALGRAGVPFLQRRVSRSLPACWHWFEAGADPGAAVEPMRWCWVSERRPARLVGCSVLRGTGQWWGRCVSDPSSSLLLVTSFMHGGGGGDVLPEPLSVWGHSAFLVTVQKDKSLGMAGQMQAVQEGWG